MNAQTAGSECSECQANEREAEKSLWNERVIPKTEHRREPAVHGPAVAVARHVDQVMGRPERERV